MNPQLSWASRTIGKIFGSIGLGIILALLISTLVFQGVMFHSGLETLGIGKGGATYFACGFAASLILMFQPGARNCKRLIAFFPIAILVVGALALGDLTFETAGVSGDSMIRMDVMLKNMAAQVAMLVFWVTPAAVTGYYAYLSWAAERDNSEKVETN